MLQRDNPNNSARLGSGTSPPPTLAQRNLEETTVTLQNNEILTKLNPDLYKVDIAYHPGIASSNLLQVPNSVKKKTFSKFQNGSQLQTND